MSGKKDDLIGRGKEAAGAILDDESLRAEGRLDQLVGDVKEQAEKVVDRVRDAITPDDAEDPKKKDGE